MKKFLMSALSAGVLAMATAALAQPAAHHERPAAEAAARSHHEAQAARRTTSRARVVERRAARVTTRERTATRQARRATTQANRARARAVQATRRDSRVVRREDQVVRRDRRLTNNTARVERRDITRYRANVRATHRYHYARPYVRPAGWYARTWTYGQRFPRAWYAQQYWIPNFLAFGLMSPPAGYEWVRYGDDALLIDLATGEIIRVKYGLFY
jgi:Ni/Co efflux regulator RcnB